MKIWAVKDVAINRNYKLKAIVSMGVVFFVIFMSMDTMADAENGIFFLTPFFAGNISRQDQISGAGSSFGLGGGYQFSEHWRAEAVFQNTDNSLKAGDYDGGAHLYRVDGFYRFHFTETLFPYLTTGVGIIMHEVDNGDSDKDPLFNFGAGLEYPVTENLTLRGDLRHTIFFDNVRDNNLSSQYNTFFCTFGLTFYFDGKRKMSIAQEDEKSETESHLKENETGNTTSPHVSSSQPLFDAVASNPNLPVDRDRDNVPDYLDRCVGTPAGVLVDRTGCPQDKDNDGVYDYMDRCPNTPENVIVVSSGCPQDKDGDGFYDYLDRCPDNPPNIRVDNNGCPMDEDRDGVYDYEDLCMGTPADARVDKRGCWVINNVKLDKNKTGITPDSIPVLNEVLVVLKKEPSLKIEIQGHTDHSGSTLYNLTLSQNRARAVMEYLIKKGIKGDRLSARGYGSTMPIVPNDKSLGRSINRRIELYPVH